MENVFYDVCIVVARIRRASDAVVQDGRDARLTTLYLVTEFDPVAEESVVTRGVRRAWAAHSGVDSNAGTANARFR